MSIFPGVPTQADLLMPQEIHGKRILSRLSMSWQNWLIQVQQALSTSTVLASGTGAVASTPIRSTGSNAGLFRVGWYARITVPASISSSLQMTITWTDGGVSCSYVGPALTGNTTSTTQSQDILVQADAGTQISYSLAYSSVGTAMQYAAQVLAEAL